MIRVTGFGHAREREPHHFVVSVTRSGADVQIFEVLHEDEHGPELEAGNLRCILSWDRWTRIEDFVSDEFNRRLRDQKLKSARWKAGLNPVSRLLGKELVLLAWAIEQAEPEHAATAVANWRGLAPEERWWLYTMTAAQTGHAERGRDCGWRRALRFALCENPVACLPVAAAAVPERKRILKSPRSAAKQAALWRAQLPSLQGAPSFC